MDEFLNRITVQRKALSIINSANKSNFPLTGLSEKAIERWKHENKINEKSKLLEFIYILASKLFFLANKSQEQITSEYKILSKSVSKLLIHLESNINLWIASNE